MMGNKFYTGPFADPHNTSYPDASVCNIYIGDTPGFEYGPGKDYHSNLPQPGGVQYSYGCNDSFFILVQKETEVHSGTQTCRLPCEMPDGNVSTSKILIKRPAAQPDGQLADFYTDYSNLSLWPSVKTVNTNPREDSTHMYLFWDNTLVRSKSTYIKLDNIPDDICPPGTVFNPETGTCDVLPGWEWDDDEGEYVDTELPPIDHSLGFKISHDSPDCGVSSVLSVSIDTNYWDYQNNYDELYFFLSYSGPAVRGTDFNVYPVDESQWNIIIIPRGKTYGSVKIFNSNMTESTKVVHVDVELGGDYALQDMTVYSEGVQ